MLGDKVGQSYLKHLCILLSQMQHNTECASKSALSSAYNFMDNVATELAFIKDINQWHDFSFVLFCDISKTRVAVRRKNTKLASKRY